MKNYLYLSIAILLGHFVNAQVDRTQQPKSGPAPIIQLEDPVEFQLENGMTVLIVENHKLPKVSVNMTIENPLIFEGKKAGALSLLSSMMGKGSQSIPKNDFEEEIDFMGTRLYFSSDGAYGYCLTRYFPRVLEMLADAALHPNFLEEEFQKEKDKTLENIEASEKDVKTAASRVENLLTYGKSHPYGEFISKETLEAIRLEDIQHYYDYIFNPKNTYIAVVGDINPDEVKKQLQKHFGSWKPKTTAKIPFPEPQNTPQTEIAFVEMSNAVQSEIAITNTASLDKKNPDYFAVLIANQILGGGGEARLFLNLREDKGFTYGAYSGFNDSYMTKAKFKASTSVRNAVTDSAVVEMLKEIDRIGSELISDEELELVKAKYAGTFVISLEDPETVARFALNIKTQELDSDFYKTFLQNINAVTKEDVLRVGKEYFLSNQARIIVTGKGSDILEPLENISFKNKTLKVRYYDKYGNETVRPDYSADIPEGLTAQTVIENYLKAIGGKKKLTEIKTFSEKAQASMQGMTLDIHSQKTDQKQARMEMKMMGNVMQKQVTNKDYAYMEMQGQRMNMEGDQLEQMIKDATIFPELDYDTESIEFVGTTDVEGVNAFEIKVSEKLTNFYDAITFFKIQVKQTVEMMGMSQTSTVKYGDYKSVNGIFFPHKSTFSMGPQEIDFISSKIELNQPIDPTVFK